MRFLMDMLLAAAQSGATQEPPIVRYRLALIAAGAAVGGVLLTILGSRWLEGFKAKRVRQNAEALQKLQEEVSLKLERAKQELTLASQREMEQLKAQVADLARQRDARLDYEYEAHKRLYRECGPLLFQLAEFSQMALYRIYSLARSARQGSLPQWLSGEGYYMRSTMYFLIAPLAIFRLIQRRLTLVDLTLDQHIARQYALLRLLYLTFTDDFEFAKEEPAVAYEPSIEDWREKRIQNEARYWRQGVFLGALDNTIDAMIREDGAIWRTFGDFETAYRDKSHVVHKSCQTLCDVLNGFHPRTRPVLWRMLVAQSLVHEMILAGLPGAGAGARVDVSGIFPERTKGDLDWRAAKDAATEEAAVQEPARIAYAYVQRQLPRVCRSSEPA